MKKIKVIFGAILILSVLLVTQIPSYAERPTVDGFIGVPWGASRAQVQAAMAKKGFAFIEQRADGFLDKYLGTFDDHPAELKFCFYKKNIFYVAEVEFMEVRGATLYAVMVAYRYWWERLRAKYGSPDNGSDAVTSSEQIVARDSYWKGIPTTVTPRGGSKSIFVPTV